MSEKVVKKMRTVLPDGTLSDFIPLGSDAVNVALTDGNDVETAIKNINNNFDNYYNKEALNEILSNFHSLDLQIVSELPTSNISTTTIYLILNTEQGEYNIYDEYVYIDNKWELLGTTSVNMGDYYTKAEVDAKVAQAYNNIPIDPENTENMNIWIQTK